MGCLTQAIGLVTTQTVQTLTGAVGKTQGGGTEYVPDLGGTP